jgi:hypothetical protein
MWPWFQLLATLALQLTRLPREATVYALGECFFTGLYLLLV